MEFNYEYDLVSTISSGTLYDQNGYYDALFITKLYNAESL